MKFNRKNVIHVLQEHIDCIDFLLGETQMMPATLEAYMSKREAYAQAINDIKELE